MLQKTADGEVNVKETLYTLARLTLVRGFGAGFS